LNSIQSEKHQSILARVLSQSPETEDLALLRSALAQLGEGLAVIASRDRTSEDLIRLAYLLIKAGTHNSIKSGITWKHRYIAGIDVLKTLIPRMKGIPLPARQKRTMRVCRILRRYLANTPDDGDDLLFSPDDHRLYSFEEWMAFVYTRRISSDTLEQSIRGLGPEMVRWLLAMLATLDDTRAPVANPHGAKDTRNATILAARSQGLTLDAIGAQHNLTRERVRQIIASQERRSLVRVKTRLRRKLEGRE
jgi:hypothetical protein